ncbi:MAG: flagellar motor switch protein FliN [Planctomycetota bacterium]
MNDHLEEAGEILKVLIVDSDPGRSTTLAEAVKNCGFDGEKAQDWKTAAKCLLTKQYHIVLCQESLADAKGLDVLKFVRQEYPDLPVIIITANAQSVPAAEALRLGAADILTMPADLAVLFPKLTAVHSRIKTKDGGTTTVHPVQLPHLQLGTSHSERASVDMVLDVPVTINASLGTTNMLISDLLQLGPGSVVELGKRAGEPVDLFVNDKLIAVGEVVVVNDTFGVRVTEVIDAKQRVQALS